MASLLHLDSAANRTGESVSRQLTALFADIWRTRHGEAGYRYRDLVAEPVPPLDTAYCTLGRRLERGGLVAPSEVGALTGNPAERREWASTLPLITELLAAETVLIGAPMYNYAIPAALKAWIDRVSFPGAFTEPTTGENLLRDTQIVVISSRRRLRQGNPASGMRFPHALPARAFHPARRPGSTSALRQRGADRRRAAPPARRATSDGGTLTARGPHEGARTSQRRHRRATHLHPDLTPNLPDQPAPWCAILTAAHRDAPTGQFYPKLKKL